MSKCYRLARKICQTQYVTPPKHVHLATLARLRRRRRRRHCGFMSANPGAIRRLPDDLQIKLLFQETVWVRSLFVLGLSFGDCITPPPIQGDAVKRAQGWRPAR